MWKFGVNANMTLFFANALVLVACDQSGASPKPEGTTGAAPAATAAPAAPAGDESVSAASVEIAWTGKWQPGDAPKDEFPVYRVTNKAKNPLTFLQLWHYFYDKDKKQLGRTFTERYQMSIAPGATQEIGAGPKKAELPPGTTHLEAVVAGANFGSEARKFRDPQPPEQRAFKGN